jgi:hypothetical protein
MENPNLKGAIAEAAIAYEATRLGVDVFKPLSEHSRADLIFGMSSAIPRAVQVSQKDRRDRLHQPDQQLAYTSGLRPQQVLGGRG